MMPSLHRTWASLRPSLTSMARPALAIVVALMTVGCAGARGTPAGSDGLASAGTGPVVVVATTTVFADMVQNVGGNLVQAVSLVPRNGDVHTFEPKPADVVTVSKAQLIVMNGLGLDDWVEKTVTNAAAGGTPLIKLGDGLPGVDMLPGEDPGTQNPHLWMDVKYAELYVDRISAALVQVDPAHATAYQSQAAAYRTRLDALDAEVRSTIATIPEANRKLVAFHDAFPYYAREYGVTIVGVAVEAPGQDPSAGYTAKLIQAIRAAGVKAIFSEAQFPTKLVDQLARETGTTVVANLYDDALGDPPITSYEAIIRWDTDQLVAALK
jgi:manganese/iron transport system substrate-binding protein